MAASLSEFEDWLHLKLQALNTDQEVFGGYIKGILEGDETNEEKLEALEEILVEVSEDEISSLCKDILTKWNVSAKESTAEETKFDVDAKIAVIMEKQAQTVASGRKLTQEEKNYRAAILAQYSEVSDHEDVDDDDPGGGSEATPNGSCGDFLRQNTNAEDVLKSEREQREKARAEVEKKKALDKANREKQKQQQLDRKEKEKRRTQKGEKKR